MIVRLRYVRHEVAASRSRCTWPPRVPEPRYDVTYLFYEAEEVESSSQRARPGRAGAPGLAARPTSRSCSSRRTALVEAGCQGTLRATVRTSGRRAHSARSWLGVNAIHARRRGAAAARGVPAAHGRRSTAATYREGLNAVGIRGGVAGNVIPDECAVEVNFRFAPDRTAEAGAEHTSARCSTATTSS